MLSSMQTGIWGGQISSMSIRRPMTPVWIPYMICAEESMQSPNDVNSKCLQVTLHSGIDLMNRLRISMLYCIGSWQTNAWRWHLERSSAIIANWIAMKSACRFSSNMFGANM